MSGRFLQGISALRECFLCWSERFGGGICRTFVWPRDALLQTWYSSSTWNLDHLHYKPLGCSFAYLSPSEQTHLAWNRSKPCSLRAILQQGRTVSQSTCIIASLLRLLPSCKRWLKPLHQLQKLSALNETSCGETDQVVRLQQEHHLCHLAIPYIHLEGIYHIFTQSFPWLICLATLFALMTPRYRTIG